MQLPSQESSLLIAVIIYDEMAEVESEEKKSTKLF